MHINGNTTYYEINKPITTLINNDHLVHNHDLALQATLYVIVDPV